MSARVLPVLALLSAAILYLTDIENYLEIFFTFIAISFLAVSITWWWWVMFAVKNIQENITKSVNQFENIREDIRKLRKDIYKVKQMFVIGNGESRKNIAIDKLPGNKIGCNAIIREYFVDHLICVDRRMVDEASTKHSENYTYIYTRDEWISGREDITNLKPVPDLPYKGTLRADEPFHWGSGPFAVLLASKFEKNIKLLGFDLHSESKYINNIYKDTQNYDPSTKTAIDPRYWIHQIGKVFENFPNNNYTIYCNKNWKLPKEWQFSNVSLDSINNL